MIFPGRSAADAAEPGEKAGEEAWARAGRLVGKCVEFPVAAGNLVSTEIHGTAPCMPAMLGLVS